MSIWRAGHAHLEGIVAGLDAVDAQVGHYSSVFGVTTLELG
jgi:hypothetical protein